MNKATRKQTDYIRDLAERAGYSGNLTYRAAKDLLGDGREGETRESASRLIDALKEKLGESAPAISRRDDPETINRVAHDGTRWTEY